MSPGVLQLSLLAQLSSGTSTGLYLSRYDNGRVVRQMFQTAGDKQWTALSDLWTHFPPEMHQKILSNNLGINQTQLDLHSVLTRAKPASQSAPLKLLQFQLYSTMPCSIYISPPTFPIQEGISLYMYQHKRHHDSLWWIQTFHSVQSQHFPLRSGGN